MALAVATPTSATAPLFPETLRRRARDEPERIALRLVRRDGVATLRHAAWSDRADAVATGLIRLGVGLGDRIGLVFNGETYLEYVIAYMGTLRAGGVAVPLSRAMTDLELGSLLGAAGVRRVLVGAGVRAPQTADPVTSTKELERCATDRPRLPPLREDDAAEILFTSGSTGPPRPVSVTYGNLAAEIAVEDSQTATDLRYLHSLPVGTSYGQSVLRASLAASATTVVMPGFDGSRYLVVIDAYGVTDLFLVPAMGLVVADLPSGGDLSSVQRIWLSGASSPPSMLERLARRFPDASIYSTYTSTEAWPARTVMEFGVDRPRSIGRPRAGDEVSVVDAEGRRLPPGNVGWIRLRSFTAPSRTIRDLGSQPGGWTNTGDLGVEHDDGSLTLLDRATDVINTGGLKIYTPEVEAVLVEHPAVREAAVLGVDDELRGQRPVAAVIPASMCTTGELIRFARRRLAAYKVPEEILMFDDLPRTRSGKASKRALRRGFDQLVGPAAPEDDGARLLRIWREALDRADVGPADRFLELGGSSLEAFAIIARIRRELDVDVPASELLMASTVGEQLAVVKRRRLRSRPNPTGDLPAR